MKNVKYEYTYVKNRNPDQVKKELNELGADGWLVVGVGIHPDPPYDGFYHTVYLMRVKDETPPPLRVVPRAGKSPPLVTLKLGKEGKK